MAHDAQPPLRAHQRLARTGAAIVKFKQRYPTVQCPRCSHDNDETRRFCAQCAAPLPVICAKCGFQNGPADRFCGGCAHELPGAGSHGLLVPGREPLPLRVQPGAEGERRNVTVMFSDLSGYTAMSERLDPEEVKEIVGGVFREAARIVGRYEGTIEKYIGDAVMAVFGIPDSHEDDPLRAIRAAREIHQVVEKLQPKLAERLEAVVAMHTGINTGLVVTGESHGGGGAMGVVGDTVNLASRLCSLAKAGEIMVSASTRALTERYVTFVELAPAAVKGKAKPVLPYRVVEVRERPLPTRRQTGLQSALIGRQAELDALNEAVTRLKQGRSTVVLIVGEPGTGKSRLVEEFVRNCEAEEVTCSQGQAFQFAQNVPYYPLIDQFSKLYGISDGDKPEQVRQKIETNLAKIGEGYQEVAGYVARLFSVEDEASSKADPESWRLGFHDALRRVCEALAKASPTVFIQEDVHWSDPSMREMLRFLIREMKIPAALVLTMRPPGPFALEDIPADKRGSLPVIRLDNLSADECRALADSLLSDSLPDDLLELIETKTGGNPFYMEEMIASLIETKALVREHGRWRIDAPLGESAVPITVQGVISARLNRLTGEMRRVLQEASVIGRSFLNDILLRITEVQRNAVSSLAGLEQLDLIRTAGNLPGIEYMFKHPLTQEVVYNSLLKSERRTLHERVGNVMEKLYENRLPEHYETLAYHFKLGTSPRKAVDYLMKAGAKSLRRFAIDEAHRYYHEAYDLLTDPAHASDADPDLLLDLMADWAIVHHYSGYHRRLTELFQEREQMIAALPDRRRRSLGFAWIAFGLWNQERYRESHDYMTRARRLAEESGAPDTTAFAAVCLTWICAELGRLSEAVEWGRKGQEMVGTLRSENQIFLDLLLQLAYGGMAYTRFLMGDSRAVGEEGTKLHEIGARRASNRCTAWGHTFRGFADNFIAGRYLPALEAQDRALQLTSDPVVYASTMAWRGFTYMLLERWDDAQHALDESLVFSRQYGFDYVKSICEGATGVVMIAKGQMARGLEQIERTLRNCAEHERRCFEAYFEYILGRVFVQMVTRSVPIPLLAIIKNLPFLLRTLPFAAGRAEQHLGRSIALAEEAGAGYVAGIALLDLGVLHLAKGRKSMAAEALTAAVSHLERCGAELLLSQAREALARAG
jgi:class 3 adenylate cyclase/tetratricopeptide (TPR) repeat protein